MKIAALALAAALAAQATPTPSPADAAFRRGDFDAAYAAYTAQLAAAPADLDALVGAGTVALYRNDLREARADLDRAAALDPGDRRIASALRALARREGSAQPDTLTMSGAQIDVPFIAVDPLPRFHLTVNGHDAVVFLDTGGASVDLTPGAAQRFGVAMSAPRQGVFAGGRTATVYSGTIARVALPGATVSGVPSMQIPAPMVGLMDAYKVDGIVGTLFLSRFLATIDYPHARLILRPRTASETFDRAAAQAGASIVPMWLVSDHLIFARGRINGGAEALFSIDTGGMGVGVQLTKAALDAAKIVPDAAKAGDFTGGGGAVRLLPFTAASVTVGTLTETNVPGVYAPDGDQYGIVPFDVAGTISHDFFRSTAVTFDFTSMRMIVQAFTSKA